LEGVLDIEVSRQEGAMSRHSRMRHTSITLLLEYAPSATEFQGGDCVSHFQQWIFATQPFDPNDGGGPRVSAHFGIDSQWARINPSSVLEIRRHSS
jgi:hypothetical protein